MKLKRDSMVVLLGCALFLGLMVGQCERAVRGPPAQIDDGAHKAPGTFDEE